ncbi:hypothetical protein ACFFX0_19315 [Citricoccus parietis]|uniref:Uncharacterized protein n=1 Tax=Citricoccus parietis TaxID=592307 RepID=A0ABV5G427_9MICC
MQRFRSSKRSFLGLLPGRPRRRGDPHHTRFTPQHIPMTIGMSRPFFRRDQCAGATLGP